MHDGVLKGFGSSPYSKREVFNISEVPLLGSDPNHVHWKILLLIKNENFNITFKSLFHV
jgi:hypothetical protein